MHPSTPPQPTSHRYFLSRSVDWWWLWMLSLPSKVMVLSATLLETYDCGICGTLGSVGLTLFPHSWIHRSEMTRKHTINDREESERGQNGRVWISGDRATDRDASPPRHRWVSAMVLWTTGVRLSDDLPVFVAVGRSVPLVLEVKRHLATIGDLV